jgi:pilus assembly protein Flp/PilA
MPSRPWGGEGGATAVEYAIMASLIAVVIVVAVTLLGSNLNELFGCAATKVGGLPGDTPC